jgi:hypothetical protein
VISVKDYPFDEQKCSIILSFWAHENWQVSFFAPNSIIDTSEHVANSIWNLSGFSFGTFETMQTYATGIYTFKQNCSNFKIELNLKRKPLNMLINSVMPCFFLNLVTFISYLVPYSSQISLSKY